jgi:hypothetical protein
MINFNIGLSNPFSHRWDTIYYKDHLFSKHKSGEIQVIKDNTIISFGFRWATRCDHAGISIDIGLFGYTAMFHYNDTRHWNHEAGRYYAYDSAGQAH